MIEHIDEFLNLSWNDGKIIIIFLAWDKTKIHSKNSLFHALKIWLIIYTNDHPPAIENPIHINLICKRKHYNFDHCTSIIHILSHESNLIYLKLTTYVIKIESVLFKLNSNNSTIQRTQCGWNKKKIMVSLSDR